MTEKMKNDFFYVCLLIEYIARKTKNKREAIVNALGKDGVIKQIKDAEVNHCLSFEQVGDEVIAQYKITDGEFDTITGSKYRIPGYLKLYSIIINDCAEEGKEVDELNSICSSFISDAISDFRTDLYYQNLDSLECSYRGGVLLD